MPNRSERSRTRSKTLVMALIELGSATPLVRCAVPELRGESDKEGRPGLA